eukprot:NODE_816_length_3731_cov_0.357379.p2 type:complete len:357 gc:universal NODE_816_length_3731_cov_0.357379:2031-3101(+)
MIFGYTLDVLLKLEKLNLELTDAAKKIDNLVYLQNVFLKKKKTKSYWRLKRDYVGLFFKILVIILTALSIIGLTFMIKDKFDGTEQKALIFVMPLVTTIFLFWQCFHVCFYSFWKEFSIKTEDIDSDISLIHPTNLISTSTINIYFQMGLNGIEYEMRQIRIANIKVKHKHYVYIDHDEQFQYVSIAYIILLVYSAISFANLCGGDLPQTFKPNVTDDYADWNKTITSNYPVDKQYLLFDKSCHYYLNIPNSNYSQQSESVERMKNMAFTIGFLSPLAVSNNLIASVSILAAFASYFYWHQEKSNSNKFRTKFKKMSELIESGLETDECIKMVLILILEDKLFPSNSFSLYNGRKG